MSDYLIDSSALWRMLRADHIAEIWRSEIEVGRIRSCEPQRAEFRRSARSQRELDEFSDLFVNSYPDATLPKSVWRWVETAQFRLAGTGTVRALSVVDLLICGTAAHHGLQVLHDDNDFETAARHLPDVRVARI